jgi:hypothetical protein
LATAVDTGTQAEMPYLQEVNTVTDWQVANSEGANATESGGEDDVDAVNVTATATEPAINHPAQQNSETMDKHTPILLKSLEMPITGNTELVFQPLHTSDYFASVGIKLGDEIKAADRLGRQMKSFTEWLKTMKKLHPEALQTAHSIADSDEKVAALAAASNQNNEVITEAMAEVLVQQGKTSQAVAVYEKLSLLNPGKSAFFAAQIKKLKA